jgi:hypothetical protein
MTDLFDTASLPDSPAYWDSLARRITAAATQRQSAISWLAGERAGWLAAAIACVAAVLLLWLPLKRRGDLPGSGWTVALGPRDALGQQLIAPATPPMLTSLQMRDTDSSRLAR